MRTSQDHILTSHVGSLPRPDALIEANRARDAGEAVARVAARKAIRALVVSPNRGASGLEKTRTVRPDMRAIIFDALMLASVRAEISHGNPQRASIVTRTCTAKQVERLSGSGGW